MAGVWFFRIGMMLSFLINGAPFGFTWKHLLDHFLPSCLLAILELYLKSQESEKLIYKYSVALLIMICTVATSVGVFAATMGMWLPRT